MGLKIVTGRTGTPHVSSNQIQAFNRAFLGDFALLDIGQHLDAVVRDANTIRIYDGCIVIQGVYAIIPYDEFEDILVEPVSVGNTRIDTIYLHYAKDMETDTETVELDIAQGEEAVNNPVKPDIDLGGDIWEGETDIRVPLYDVTVTSFDMTLTAYEYMNTYLPDISELSDRIPENIVSGVKGNAEATFRNGNVNLTAGNIGIEANSTETSTDVLTTIEIDGVVYSIAGGGSESDIPMIAEAIKQWDTSSYTINLYGIGLPGTYYPASSTYSGNRYLDVNTGIMYDCEQTGADTYTWHQAPVNLRLKTDINASAIEDIQEDISTSQTATGNPLTIESSESNLVECVAEVEAYQDLHGYDKPWVGGAGKNKLNYDAWKNVHIYRGTAVWENNGVTLTATGNDCFTDYGDSTINIPVTTGETITLTWDVQESSTGAGRVFIFGNGETSSMVDATSNIKTLTYEVPSGITFIRIRVGVTTNGNTISYKNVMVRKSGDSTFEPYSNISPITGQTEVVIEDVGKNLVDTDANQWELGTYGNNGEEYASNLRIRPKWNNYVRVQPNNTYTFSIDSSIYQYFFFAYDDNDTVITEDSRNAAWLSGSTTITFQKATRIRIGIRNPNNESSIQPSDAVTSKIQLELGSTATEYEPYKGKTYTIQLGDTIYGGELDVLTGELRVTHGEVDLGNLNYIYESSWGVSSDFYTNDIQNAVKAPLNDSTIANAICSQYKIVSRNTMYNSSESAIAILTNGIMKIRDSRYTSASDFKTAVTGQTLVYELAEPYTIQLTPQQIRLLKGTNNISCNAGDLSIKYYPDNVLGQLKGDIESEYDERIEVLEEKVSTSTIKQVVINRNAVSTDGSVMFTALTGHIIVGTSISNDANGNKCVGIPYSMGTVPALKIMNESTMAVLSNIHISGILYYIEL